MKRLSIDLNADVGESYGPYRMGADEDLFPHITSANIACGFHAGDPETMRRTLRLAAQYNVAVGAHPGYPDRLHFGRIRLPYSTEEIVDFIVYQVGALRQMAECEGLDLQHVKLHGALYHVAAEDRRLAERFLDAVVRMQRPPVVVGPPDCVLQKEADERGLDYATEGFADRLYDDEGRLAPRSGPNRGLVQDASAAAAQAWELAKNHAVYSVSQKRIELRVQTICIHGDTPGAAKIAKVVRERLEQGKIDIQSLGKIFE